MTITIEQIADLLDGWELRKIDPDFDDLVRDNFIDATEHLETIACDEADEIGVKVELAAKIEYLRECFEEVAA